MRENEPTPAKVALQLEDLPVEVRQVIERAPKQGKEKPSPEELQAQKRFKAELKDALEKSTTTTTATITYNAVAKLIKERQPGPNKKKTTKSKTIGKSQRNREQRKLLALETLDILDHGQLPNGGQPIGHLLEASVKATRSYPQDAPIPRPIKVCNNDDGATTKYSVINTTTLDAAWNLVKDHPDEKVAVLNFASAKNPGGGFLKGSLAQEESLALHSGLYSCLKGDKMYDHHAPTKGGIYTDWCIYSPDVPVFRRESDGNLLEEPWLMSVITCPCLNRSAMRKHTKMSTQQLRDAIRQRMLRFLSVLAAHHTGNLVLGAWGCGVFGNDPHMIASLFADILLCDPTFQNRWPNVVFAVLSHDDKTIGPFFQVFGN